MIDEAKQPRSLGRRDLLVRAAFLASGVMGVIALRFVNPENLRLGVLPASCGAVTGLPCIFCGMTRALHHLLNGHFERALFFNWLAFPAIGLVSLIAALFVIELTLRRQIVALVRPIHFTRRFASTGVVLLSSLWLLQVYLAISQHKRELLNPNGALYAVFVK